MRVPWGPCLLLALLVGVTVPCAAMPPRSHLNSGACLSCHSSQLATLPQEPCVSCHLGNMDFLQGHDGLSASRGLWILGAAGGGGILTLLVLGIVGVRRAAPAIAALAVAVLAAPGPGRPCHAPPQGAEAVAEGFACDLSPVLAPAGDALLFCGRGPDTNGDGCVDLRDGVALFLLREGRDLPLRLTPYALDIHGTMASWSPDGSAFCSPLPALGSDPPGLALFDSEGNRRGFVPTAGGEILSPRFSSRGDRIAFVEGRGIAIWEVARNRRTWALEPMGSPFFPRLCGWSPWGGGPLFTRGTEYSALQRGPDGKLLLPDEVPLEEASAGKAILLTPPGPVPMNRFKPQPVPGGIFYLAQSPGVTPGLFFFDGGSETLCSGPGEAVHGIGAAGEGECWAWVQEPPGKARPVLFRGPGEPEFRGPSLDANLLALAGSGDGGVWFAGAPRRGERRELRGVEGESFGSEGNGDFFSIAASGGSLAAVVVGTDSDGDGERTPWDRATLWVRWRVP